MLREWKGLYNRRLARKLSEKGRRMAKVRWDKWRRESATRPKPEPKMQRAYRFEIGFRDTFTGVEGWKPLKSARNAAMTAALILKYCQ